MRNNIVKCQNTPTYCIESTPFYYKQIDLTIIISIKIMQIRIVSKCLFSQIYLQQIIIIEVTRSFIKYVDLLINKENILIIN